MYDDGTRFNPLWVGEVMERRTADDRQSRAMAKRCPMRGGLYL